MTDLSWIKDLSHFHGTDHYHRFSPLWGSVLTDGAKFLAEKAGAFWLFDAIESHIRERVRRTGLDFDVSFVCSTLKCDLDTGNGELTLDNGDKKIIAVQSIEYTDFPLPFFELFAKWYRPVDGWVHMLPSEY